MSYADTVKDALYDWVLAATGRPVIFGNENAPRPVDFVPGDAGKYAVITAVGGRMVGMYDEPVYTDQDPVDGTDMVESLKGHRSLALGIDLYEGDVDQDMSALLQSVSGFERVLAFQAAGIAWARSGEIQNFSDVLDSEWEQRRHVDVWFNTFEASESVIVGIEEVEITDQDDGNVIIVNGQ